MANTFYDFKDLLKAQHPEAVELANNTISLDLGSAPLLFAPAPNDPDSLIMRTRVLKLADVPRSGDFAKAALAGNFFWHATRGATLSIGPDEALYLTERRLIDEFPDGDDIEASIEEFAMTVTDWQIRSSLYA
jgi:hypothetical protein